MTPRRQCLLCAPSRNVPATIATSVPQGVFAFATKKLRGENIVSVPLFGKRSRPRWIMPGGRPQHRVSSLFPSHEPHSDTIKVILGNGIS